MFVTQQLPQLLEFAPSLPHNDDDDDASTLLPLPSFSAAWRVGHPRPPPLYLPPRPPPSPACAHRPLCPAGEESVAEGQQVETPSSLPSRESGFSGASLRRWRRGKNAMRVVYSTQLRTEVRYLKLILVWSYSEGDLLSSSAISEATAADNFFFAVPRIISVPSLVVPDTWTLCRYTL